MRLDNKLAAVTGAGSGLGRAIALRLAAEGASVAATDIEPAAAFETAKQVADSGGRAGGYGADVSRAAELDAAVAAAVAAFGPLEIMVNNAGVLDGYFDVDDMGESLWRRVIEIDLTGTFLGCKRALAEMLPRGSGRIVAPCQGRETGRRTQFWRTGLSVPRCAEEALERGQAVATGTCLRLLLHGGMHGGRFPCRFTQVIARAYHPGTGTP